MVIVHYQAEVCSLLSVQQSLLSIQQSNNPRTVNQVEHENCPINKQIATDFPDLISRIGKSKLLTVRSKFHTKYTPTHQKGLRVPINLVDKVSDELK